MARRFLEIALEYIAGTKEKIMRKKTSKDLERENRLIDRKELEAAKSIDREAAVHNATELNGKANDSFTARTAYHMHVQLLASHSRFVQACEECEGAAVSIRSYREKRAEATKSQAIQRPSSTDQAVMEHERVLQYSFSKLAEEMNTMQAYCEAALAHVKVAEDTSRNLRALTNTFEDEYDVFCKASRFIEKNVAEIIQTSHFLKVAIAGG